MKTILITGATGNTGSATIKALKRYDDIQLRAMTRNPDKAAAFKKEGIEGVVADFSDATSLDRAMEGVDTVFLVHTPSLDLTANEKKGIDAARKAGVKKIVKVSVFGCDPKAPINLPRMHAEVEAYLKDSGLAHTILRPHSFMQNLLGSAPAIQSHGAIYSNAGDGTIPLIDARDIGAVAATAIYKKGHEGKTYELTGPAAVSYYDIAKAIGKAIGKEVKYVPVPDEAAKQGMLDAGFPEWLADDLIALMQIWRKGIGAEPTDDVQKILGRPGRSIEDFSRDYAAVFKG